MLIATKPQEAADLQQRQALLQQHGITATFVDGDEARRLEPALGTPRPPPELGSAVAVEGALVTSSDTQIVSGCSAGHVGLVPGIVVRAWAATTVIVALAATAVGMTGLMEMSPHCPDAERQANSAPAAVQLPGPPWPAPAPGGACGAPADATGGRLFDRRGDCRCHLWQQVQSVGLLGHDVDCIYVNLVMQINGSHQ